jgi:hypothetical protein
VPRGMKMNLSNDVRAAGTSHRLHDARVRAFLTRADLTAAGVPPTLPRKSSRDASGGHAVAQPAHEAKSLNPRLGELTLENDFSTAVLPLGDLTLGRELNLLGVQSV